MMGIISLREERNTKKHNISYVWPLSRKSVGQGALWNNRLIVVRRSDEVFQTLSGVIDSLQFKDEQKACVYIRSACYTVWFIRINLCRPI